MNNNDEFRGTVADTKQANFIDAQLESARSPEVRGIIEELAETSNDTDIAAKRGPGPNESYRKLRVWGLSFKRLKNRIDDRINNHRGNLKQISRDAKELPLDIEETYHE